MRDLIVKLEGLKESKERSKIVDELRESMVEKNAELLEGHSDDDMLSEGDIIRHEIKFITELMGKVTIKDKECKEAIVADLEKSKNWRINKILGKTHEYQLDSIGESYFNKEDKVRAENWWVECFENLPNKLAEELKLKETQVEEMKEAEVQEQIDALSSLEAEGL